MSPAIYPLAAVQRRQPPGIFLVTVPRILLTDSHPRPDIQYEGQDHDKRAERAKDDEQSKKQAETV